MVVSCSAFGCVNRHGERPGLGFYRFPKEPHSRRLRWIKAVRRKDWASTVHSRICDDHFVSGKPVADCCDVDYIPTVFSFKLQSVQNRSLSESHHKHEERVKNRSELFVATEREKKRLSDSVDGLLLLQDSEFMCDATTQTASIETQCSETQTANQSKCSETQTAELLCTDHFGYVPTIPSVITLGSIGFRYEHINTNDEAIRFNTGLPTCAVVNHVLAHLLSCSPRLITKKNARSCLRDDDRLLLTLMRLRLNLLVQDIAYCFNIGESTVSDIFHTWMDAMYLHLKFLIKWPERETCCSNMPKIFKDLFPKARCIIDCSEIYIERPYAYQARAQTYSNYKKHNTVKFLVGITPCGAISFLSKCWGGRATDKFITMNSGFLALLEPGDVILADRGFDVGDDIAIHGAKLEIPAFTRGKRQLSMGEVEYSKQLSKVRIHIERVIGLLKNKYTILQGTLPVATLKGNDVCEMLFIDQIVTVCAALLNLFPGIVETYVCE